MGNIQRYTAYHATDKQNIKDIIENDFKFKKSDEHWLGNGVYFFKDVALAEKWGKKTPTKKFGSIENYAIIEAIIEVDDDYVCDLTMLNDYKFVEQCYNDFKTQVYNSGRYINSYSLNRIRCAFFDWMIEAYNFKCIIAQFNTRKFPENNDKYIHSDKEKLTDLKIVYNEVQICVTDTDCIIIKKKYRNEER